MISVQDPSLQRKINKLVDFGQGHIFRFWTELNSSEQKHLLKQIEAIDLAVLDRQQKMLKQKSALPSESPNLQPAEVVNLKKRQNRDSAVLPLGEEALRKGQVAAFLVAGGQGSRLGFNHPKGMFPITPVSGKSLFQVFSEKIQYLQIKYKTRIPWYIMTSETNHSETVDFFNLNHFFQLDPKAVRFFSQDMLPALDRAGKLILQERHSLFFNPNGHGGSVNALYKHGILEEMKQNGQKQLFYFQVDNVLVNICDPVFLGYHIATGADMATKVVRKASADERMGIICKVNGRDGVVEYSDLSDADMYAKNEEGELKYWAGNTAIHLFDVDFMLKRAQSGTELPFHLAEKSIPAIDPDGKGVKSVSKKGIKFETFVFDLLKDVQKSMTLEVERKKEFSAVKNKQGSDSPETAKKDLLWNYANWITSAGLDIEQDEQGNPMVTFEISPLFALNAKDIMTKKDSVPEITEGLTIG